MNTLSDCDVDDVRQKIDAGFSQRAIQTEYGIAHLTTVARFCKRHHIGRFPRAVTADEAGDLVDTLKHDDTGNSVRENWGEVKIYDCLSALGFRIPRSTVRKAMHSRDADGVARRRRRAIVRRVYHAPHVNYVWHSDTNMKLVRWGIWIYASVDGYSKFLLHVVAADNISKGNGVLAHGRDMLQYLAIPDLLRVDAGGENNSAIALQRAMGGAVHVGSSVHNQPVERWWGTWRTHLGEHFRQIFYQMENAGELNAEDECDLDALRYSFLPVIREHCDILRITHNAGHKPGHGKPRLLFNRGAPPQDTTITWDEFQRGCRLPFSAEILATRDFLVARMDPKTPREKYFVVREANRILLLELQM